MSLAEHATPPGQAPEAWPAIKRLSIEKLFGRYSYLDLSPSDPARAESVALLYGDNGGGKTTLLKLIYSSLSPQDRHGHRTYVSKTPFASFKVEFSDGTTIAIVKDRDNLLGSYVFRICRKGVSKEFHVNANKDNNVKIDDNPDIPMLREELKNLD